ncbi:beta transducin [Didymella sp. IMI 355093]|nr:beta transducin [Didymella sp. IMI 355093]
MAEDPKTWKVKTRRKTGPVRRLENGMLDVTRKSSNNVKVIKADSQSLLLRLPPELRNRIWEYALGGHVFDVVTRTVYERRKRINKAKVWDLPKNTFALLRVCRQIYAEPALLPYKHNAFRFKSEDAFDWVASLRPVQQNLISEIHIATLDACCMLAKDQIPQQCSLLPIALHIDRFPGLKIVSFGVYRSLQFDEKIPAIQQPLATLIRKFITNRERRIVQHLRKAKPDVRVAFKRF